MGTVTLEKPMSKGSDYNIELIRADFPILKELIHGKPLVYLDNAATTQKPRQVIDALSSYYQHDNSNIHRAVHQLSERATRSHDQARRKVQKFLNAERQEEIIFTRNSTEAINLVAQSYGRKNFSSGDEVIISAIEHHANIVPWQMICEERGAVLRVIPVDDSGELILESYADMLSERTKFVALTHMSNALGTITPVHQMIEMAHAVGAPILIDGSQAAYHMSVDVQALDCDFYTVTGHKLYGPTGIGVLYGKKSLLEAMPPYQGGGDMILSVTFEKTIYNDLPFKFEAGTPDIAGAIGLGAAIDYINSIGIDNMAAHEKSLLEYATPLLEDIPGLRLIGTSKNKASILSFILGDIHPHDVGTILDQAGIAIRTGHHCAQPVMKRYNVPATARASIACYNTYEEIDALIKGIYRVQEVMG